MTKRLTRWVIDYTNCLTKIKKKRRKTIQADVRGITIHKTSVVTSNLYFCVFFSRISPLLRRMKTHASNLMTTSELPYNTIFLKFQQEL